jgi:nicotinamidase-related amidase
MTRPLLLPPHYDPSGVSKLWRPDTDAIAAAAERWSRTHGLPPSDRDDPRVALLLVDVQHSFCLPEFPLFVRGRSGNGAVEDNRRLCAFVYRNLASISQILPTMDTHKPAQVFHPWFWVDRSGEHPAPFTLISAKQVEDGVWSVNPEAAGTLGLDLEYLQRFVRHYACSLKEGGKYDLTIWPYHVLLGSPGHALVSSVHEAVFFHAIARKSQPRFHVKGDNPLTEHYSVLGPEILRGPAGEEIAAKNDDFLGALLGFDAILVAGQAKSHCLAWTIDDLLDDIEQRDRSLAEKIYLLEDCTSPVVVPGAMDYTEEADEAFRRFERGGMHVVRTTIPLAEWPGFPAR